MFRKCLLLPFLVMALALAGCNTVKGFGKDIHDATQNVQEWMEGESQHSDYIIST